MSRNRPELVRGEGSRPLSLSEMVTDTWGWEWNARRRLRLLLEVGSSSRSFLWFLWGEAIAVTRLGSHIQFLVRLLGSVRMVPAPRGAGIVVARVPKKVLKFAGIDDVFTSSRGSTKTLGNFVKVCLCPYL